MQIGMLETVGLDWRLSDEEVARIRAVTPEQVQAVARKYLTDANLTIAELKPQSMEQANHQAGRRAAAGGRHGA
jgi:zinc protease